MTLKIQETKISGSSVEILIADSTTKEASKEWVHFSVQPTQPEKASPGVSGLAALQRLRDIISDEIQKIPFARDHLS